MRFFLGILAFFLAFGWLVLLFATTGLFYTGTIVLSILVSAVISGFASLSLRSTSWRKSNPGIAAVAALPRNDKKNRLFYVAIVISLLVSLTTCYFATPTVFGGRDQGAIATAAIELSRNHNLEIQSPLIRDLFEKYGPGRALNFPGFDYKKDSRLVSRFPAGYASYLASAYNLAGLKGIQYANFIPLFFFLVIFWLILKEFFSGKVSFLGFLLAATFFPFLWFAKYALTEIYMLFLVWTGIYFLIRARDAISSKFEIESRFLYISLAAFGLSALTRIEGIIFFFLAAIYIFVLNKKRIITFPKNFKKYLLIFAVFLFFLYIYLNFTTLLDSAKNFAKAFLPGTTKDSVPSASLYSYLVRIFVSYNLIAWLILGLAGIAWLAKNFRKNWTKSEFLPFFILFPSFFYLITPQITLDDPWLLRRFVFAVFPALIFYSIYFLERFFRHKIFLHFTLIVLVAANLVVSWRFFTTSENKNLLAQIEKISRQFGSDDLVLVDRLATGNSFSLASEPLRALYGKNAVYFFNAEDLEHINQSRYKNIYLISEFDQVNPWHAELTKSKTPENLEVISNNFIEPSDRKFSLAVNVVSENFMGIWKIK